MRSRRFNSGTPRPAYHMRGRALAIALGLLLGGCADPGDDVLSQAPALLEQAIEKYGDPVAGVTIGSSGLYVEFSSDGVLKSVSLPDEKASIIRDADVPAQKDFSVPETIARASQLKQECHGEWKLDVEVVSAAAVLSEATCDGHHVWTRLNDTDLPVLGTVWNAETLEVLWAEFKIIAPSLKVRNVHLSADPLGSTSVKLGPGTPQGECTTWSRSSEDPSGSSARYLVSPCGDYDPSLLDLGVLDARSVATWVAIGQQRAHIASLDGVSVFIRGYSDGPLITVSKGAQQVTLPIET